MSPRFKYAITIVFLCCGRCFCKGEQGAPDGEDLLAIILANNEENRFRIQSASGSAVAVFERDVDPSYHPAPGTPPRDPRMKSHFEKRRIEWYVSDDRRRTDEVSLGIPDTKNRGLLPRNRKQSWSPESNIYVHYRPSGRVEAYINRPIEKRYLVPRLAIANFDPMAFYKCRHKDLREWIEYGKKTGATVEVVSEPGQYLIRLKWRSDPAISADMTAIVDPAQGHNVLRMVAERDGKTIFTVEAEYVRLGEGETAVFFPKKYAFADYQPGFWEKVNVEFSDIQINQPIDDTTFTFDGMGVPPGTIMRDMRYDPAHPVVTYYAGMPDKELQKLLDDIDPNEIRNAIDEGDVNLASPSGVFATNRESPLSEMASDVKEPDARVHPSKPEAWDPFGWPGWIMLLMACMLGVSVAGAVLLRRRRSE